MNSIKIAQSYIYSQWFVSTIERDSSAMVSPPLRFYETIVWEWNPATKENGKMLYIGEGGESYHSEVCRTLIINGLDGLKSLEEEA